MNTGKIIADLRESKGWSQSELANRCEVSRVMIGKYERGEAVPSIEAAKKIADALQVSLDYLAGETSQANFDRQMIKRLENVENLEPQEKERIFHFIDLIIRDAKARQAYTS